MKHSSYLAAFALFNFTFCFVQSQCFESISTDGRHILASKDDGTFWAWGWNTSGQLGNGSLIDSNVPQQLMTETDWTYYDAGNFSNLVIKSDGTLWAWGRNQFGQLGDGTFIDRASPIQIGTENDWSQVFGGSNQNFALKDNGTLWTWGDNTEGELGNGENGLGNEVSIPTQIGTDNNWFALATGFHHEVALKNDGTLWTWGFNGLSQLGLGNNVDHYEPVQISPENNWAYIASGYDHSFAIKTDGTLYAWGGNFAGEIGNGTLTNFNPLQKIGNDNDWQEIAAGQNHSIALKTNGTIWVWGNNGSGELGLGSVSNVLSPTQLGTDADWIAIDAGRNFCVALKADGSLWTWGNNFHGTIGDGTFQDRNIPTLIEDCDEVLMPVLSVNRPELNFGTILISTDTSLNILIENTGNDELIVYDFIFGDDAFYCEMDSISIGPNESFELEIFFNPSDPIDYASTVNISSNGGDFEIDLLGSGFQETMLFPILAVSPTELDFGTVQINHESALILSFENTGNGPLIIYNFLFGAAVFYSDLDSIILNPDEIFELEIHFNPTQAIQYSNSLIIESNGGNFEINLTGTGFMETAIEDFTINKLDISPNPTSDFLRIKNISNTQISGCKIYDCRGKLLLNDLTFYHEISVSHLPSGKYFIVIEMLEERMVKAFVKE